MSLRFFDNAIESNMCPSPDQNYRELNQAFIDQQWENTTALKIGIDEQDVNDKGQFDHFEFHKVDAWISYVVGQTSSGLKNGDDFAQLIFRSIEHPCIKGRYYRFDNNYWLTYFTSENDSIDKSIALRRCNNFLRIVDPLNGSIYSIPCVVGYEMSSPSMQVSKYINTPNNHATVLVQGNKDTVRLLKLNTRYVLGGRVFKLQGQQNAIYEGLLNQSPTILYLDLFLDEVHNKDNFETQVADNGEYNYAISIDSEPLSLNKNAQGVLKANLTLNGKEVNRNIVWSSDSPAIQINNKGEYLAVGENGDKANIRVTLEGNSEVFSELQIVISDEIGSDPIITIDNDFDKVRECETITFNLAAFYNGKLYSDSIESSVSLSKDKIVENSELLSVEKLGNNYRLECHRFSKSPITLYLTVKNETPEFLAKVEKQIRLVNIFE